MLLIDTHIHLYEKSLLEEIDINIKEALLNDVKILILIGVDIASSKSALELANKYSNMYVAIGIHPTYCLDAELDFIFELEELIKNDINKKIIAIGEIGLDYHQGREFINKIGSNLELKEKYYKKQMEFFIAQLNLAKKYSLPIVIHARDSYDDVYGILNQYKNHYKRGIIHYFDSDLDYAYKFIDLGFCLGFGGAITFKNSTKLKNIAQNIGLENIVLETDAPYVTPEPNRSEINKPKNIKRIALEIAQIKQVPLEEVANVTSNNVFKLFKIENN